MFLEQLRPVVSLLVRLGVAKNISVSSCSTEELINKKILSQSPAVSLKKTLHKMFRGKYALASSEDLASHTNTFIVFIVLEIVLYPESFRGSAGPAELRPGRGQRLLLGLLAQDGVLLGLPARDEALRLRVKRFLDLLLWSSGFDFFLSS